ncbi:MAG: Fic family protein, partial [Acidobacteria bacterium]|nr:Fic family protein [Acidobacteriota bacterium]
MLFKTPKLRGDELEAVERIRELWMELAWQLRSIPSAQTDLLRRFTVARAIRGSTSIEGVSVS